MPGLVFVHGRNQQGRDPAAMRRSWAAGYNKGLTAARLPVLDEAAVEAISFPFYGNVLYAQEIQGRAAVPDVATLTDVGWIDPGFPPQVNMRQVAMLESMASELGGAPFATLAETQGVPGGPLFRGLLAWVANHSGVDEAVIRGYLRDVSVYLELPGCRPAVQDVVRPALLGSPVVLVGHSLGGVVCAELLAEPAVAERVALFVAVGAPLGLDAVTSRMRPSGSARPKSSWVNVYDPRDWVPLGSPLSSSGGLRAQIRVANPRGYEHSIEHYLAHSEVASVIAEAVAGVTGGEPPLQDEAAVQPHP